MESYWNINDGFLRVTSEHPLYVYDGTKWYWMTPTEIKNSSASLKLSNHDGNFITINSIVEVVGEIEVVNIDVEPLDVYFGGGYLMHNVHGK